MADTSVFEPYVLSGRSAEGVLTHENALRYLGERLQLVPHLRRAIHPLDDVRALGELVRVFRRERFDVIHTHMSKAGVLGRIAARLGDPSALVVHTAHGWSFWHSPSWAVRNAVRLVERMAARWTDMLLVVCDHDREIALNEFRLPASLLGDGRAGVPVLPDRTEDRIASARRRLGLPVEGPVVGTVTRLVRDKRVEDFLRAAALVSEATSPPRFVVVGSGPEEQRLRAIACELSLEPVWFPTRSDVVDVLPAFDVFVHPSRFEGLPMAVLHAMSASVPVVAQDAGGTREAVRHGETGLLVPVGDVEAMAQAIMSVLSSPELAAQLASAAKALVGRRHVDSVRVRAIEQQYLRRLGPHAIGYNPHPQPSERAGWRAGLPTR